MYSWFEPWTLWTKVWNDFANVIIWQHSTEAANKSRFVLWIQQKDDV